MAEITPIKRKKRGRGRPFAKGNAGRPKGIPNKNTRDIRERARELLEDPDYVAALKQRLLTGEANAVEALLFHYGYGKPKDIVQLQGGPRPLVIDLVAQLDIDAHCESHDGDDE